MCPQTDRFVQNAVVKKATLKKFVIFLAGTAAGLWPVLSRCNLGS